MVGSAPNRLAMAARLPDLLGLFPTSYAHSLFPVMCADAFDTMAELMPDGDLPRVPGWRGVVDYEALVARYGKLPDNPKVDPRAIVRSMSADLFAGTTVWRCAQLQYNIGAALNVVAAAMYALALDLNVYLISDGQAGNAVLAEQSVGTILADLSGVPAERAHGLFTFGGTGTIAYALKAGIRKCAPTLVQSGIPADTDVMITEDAHFSHQTVCDWLGIGADRLIVVPADSADRRSDLGAAERLLRERIESGSRVAAFPDQRWHHLRPHRGRHPSLSTWVEAPAP